MRVLLTIAAAAGTLLAVAPGAAAPTASHAKPPKEDVRDSPDLWGTINVCDTAAHPDTIGIRGSMPGLGRRAGLWMRFQVQYMAKGDGKWHNIDANADSAWMKLGVARNRVIESGQNFTFLPPPGGGVHMLRGAVSFKWVVQGKTVKRLREITESGHRSTAGADPPGFSAARCLIS
jgi:hypothetical protein